MAGTKASGRPSNRSQIKIEGPQHAPEMPLDLSDDAQEVWRLAVEALPHVLRPVDGPALKLACVCYAHAIHAFAQGDSKHGAAVAKAYIALADKLGLHPASRNIIRPIEEPKGGENDDIVAKLLARGGLN
jgi:phage terminase small subunit